MYKPTGTYPERPYQRLREARDLERTDIGDILRSSDEQVRRFLERFDADQAGSKSRHAPERKDEQSCRSGEG